MTIHTDGKDTASNAPRTKTTRLPEATTVNIPTMDAILIAKLARTEADCGTAGSEEEMATAVAALERLEEKLST